MAASVLVIDAEEWVSAMLIDALRDAGFDARGVGSAQDGLTAVLRQSPGCVVCALDLPAPGGIWVLQSVRKEQGAVAVTPFLLLATDEDDEDDLERVRSSSDRVLPKPFNVEEVLAAVKALLEDAPRLRTGHRNTRPPVAGPASLTAGSLKDTSAATLLAVLEMERRDGCLEVMGEDTYVTLVLSGGYVLSAAVDSEPATPLGAVKRLLSCKTGNFSLKGIPPQPPADHHRTIRDLVRLATGGDEPKGAEVAPRALRSPGRPPSQVLPPVVAPPVRHRAELPGPRPRIPPSPVARSQKPSSPPPQPAVAKMAPQPARGPQVAPAPSATATPIMATPAVPKPMPTPPMPKPEEPPAPEAVPEHVGSVPGPLDSRLSEQTVDELLAGLDDGLPPLAALPRPTPAETEPAEEWTEEEVLDVEADLSSFRPPSSSE